MNPDKHSFKIASIQGIFWGVFRNWGGEIIAFLVFLTLARILTPADFGLIALGIAFIGIMEIIITQGFVPSLVRLESVNSKHLNSVFLVCMSVSLGLALLLWLIADWTPRVFNEPQLPVILKSLCPILILNALSIVPRAVLMRRMAFREIAVRAVCSTALGGLVGLGLALSGFGVWSLVGQQLAHTLLGTVLIWFMASWHPKLQFSRSAFQEVAHTSFHFFGISGIYTAETQIRSFAIGYFMGTSILGFFRLARRIVDLIIKAFIHSVGDTTMTIYSKLNNNPQHIWNTFRTHNFFVGMICLPIFLLMFLGSPSIIKTLVGSEWLQAAPIIQILCIGGTIQALLGGGNPLLQAQGNTALLLKIRVIITSVSMVILFFLIQIDFYLMLIGTVIWAISGKLVNFHILRFVHPNLTFVSIFRNQIPNLCGACLLAIGWFLCRPLFQPLPEYVGLFLTTAIASALYLFVVFMLAPNVIGQIKTMVSLLMNKTSESMSS